MNKKWIIAIIAVLLVVLVTVVVIVSTTQERDGEVSPENETIDNTNEDSAETEDSDDTTGVVEDWDDVETIEDGSVVNNSDNKDNNETNNNGSDNTGNSSDNEGNQVTTPSSPPVSDFTGGGAYTYEEYTALPASEQQAYYESFESPEAFFEWYRAVKADYDANKESNELEGGSVDIGELIKDMER